MSIRRLITIILIISMLFSTNIFITAYGADNQIKINELSDEETLDKKGYFLQLENGVYGDRIISSDVKFNKNKIWGTLSDENGQKLQLSGNMHEFNPSTLKYAGTIYDKPNYKFEAYITKKDNNILINSQYKGTINILEYDDKDDLISAKTYIIENISSSKHLPSIINLEPEQLSKTYYGINANEYYQYQDSISGTGYGVQIYYPTGESHNHNHRYRVQTKQADVMNWLRNEYPDYEPAFAYGRNVDLYHNSYTGTVMNNVQPTSQDKTFSITIGYGGFSVTIPVTFSTVAISNNGSYNLTYKTSTLESWVDNYPNQTAPAEDGKIFTSYWSVSGSPGNNKIKVSIQYYAASEDSFGLRVYAYPVFSSSYTAYDSNN